MRAWQSIPVSLLHRSVSIFASGIKTLFTSHTWPGNVFTAWAEIKICIWKPVDSLRALEFAAVLTTPYYYLFHLSYLPGPWKDLNLDRWSRSVSIRAVYHYYSSQDISHVQMSVSSWNFLTSPATIHFCSIIQEMTKTFNQSTWMKTPIHPFKNIIKGVILSDISLGIYFVE